RALLQERLDESKDDEVIVDVNPVYSGAWQGLRKAKYEDIFVTADTTVSEENFLRIADAITSLPKDKKFFRKIERLFEDRKKMIKNRTFDWAMAELMAYGTLLNEGKRVRISGQDVERGTFSHRHAVITLEDSG